MAHERDDRPGDEHIEDIEHIEREICLDVDPETAWELVTNSEHLEQWLGSHVRIAPEPGADGEVIDHDGTRRRLVVDDVEPRRRIGWRWWPEGGEHDAATRVDITLRPTTGGTRVTVVERPLPHTVQARFDTAPMSMSMPAQRGAAFAWWQRLVALELATFVVHV